MHDPTQDSHESRRDPRAASTVIVGVISIALVLATVIALEALYYRTVDAELERKYVAEHAMELETMEAEQAERLGAYRWVNREAGTVAIPIERAMELVAEESGGGR